VFNTDGLNLEQVPPMNPKGMKILFDKGVNSTTKYEILAVLYRRIDEAARNDPDYTMQFWSIDGNFITYAVTYKGELKHSSGNVVLSPSEFEEQIANDW
jgi:hypothetical protein